MNPFPISHSKPRKTSSPYDLCHFCRYIEFMCIDNCYQNQICSKSTSWSDADQFGGCPAYACYGCYKVNGNWISRRNWKLRNCGMSFIFHCVEGIYCSDGYFCCNYLSWCYMPSSSIKKGTCCYNNMHLGVCHNLCIATCIWFIWSSLHPKEALWPVFSFPKVAILGL